MSVIVVANPKGGVGKSTLATQISGYLASQGKVVTLGDLDRQQSSRQWLDIRPANLPKILPWDISKDAIARPAKGATDAVIDTPAGLHGNRLDIALKAADLVVIDGDITQDIRNIRKITWVFKQGVGFNSQKIFASVKGQVGKY